MARLFFIVCCFLAMGLSSAQLNYVAPNVTEIFFDPQNLTKSVDGHVYLVEWFTILPGAHHASYSIYDPVVCSVLNFTENFDESEFPDGNVTASGILNVSSDFVGYSLINVTIYDENNNTLGFGILNVSVTLSYARFNKIFTFILAALIFIVYINMGATIDLAVVKQIVKRPIGPAVGIFCQYGLMPVIAFGLAKAFFSDNELQQLGLFLNGASPGGGASNMWTFLLGGSLDLSIMMTFVSTIVAFGAVPVWVLSLAPKLLSEGSTFVIPYDSIAMIVVSLVVPCMLGLLVQKFLPKVATFLEKRVLGPFSLFMLVFIFTVGAYSHRYVFYFFTWKILLASFALPALGYTGGLICSFLARRNLSDTIAISIETGVQNANIAIVILKFTLEHPAADLAVVLPTCGVLMTPIPLIVALVAKKVYGRFFSSGGKDITTDPQPTKEGIENGAITHISLPDMGKIPTELNGKNNNEPGEGKIIKRDKLFGVDNPAVSLEYDVL